MGNRRNQVFAFAMVGVAAAAVPRSLADAASEPAAPFTANDLRGPFVFRDLRSHARLLGQPDPRALGREKGFLIEVERPSPAAVARGASPDEWDAYTGHLPLAMHCCLEPDRFSPPRLESGGLVFEKAAPDSPLYLCSDLAGHKVQNEPRFRRISIKPDGDSYVASYCGRRTRVQRSISSSEHYRAWDHRTAAAISAEAKGRGFAVPSSTERCMVQALACDVSKLALACEEGDGLVVVFADRAAKRHGTRGRFATVETTVDCSYALDRNGDPEVP
jgi:hypothetical protein